ncbi:MAG: 8-oxoguanine deaminase [Hasllibacter sp.]
MERHLLIRGAARVMTMDGSGEAGRELAGADIRVRGGVIDEVGAALAPGGAEVIEASAHVVTPGLVNTHHHLFQTLTRAVPAAQDAPLFGWLRTLYPIWARMTPEDIRISATLGMAELALSGCSMSSDHLYLFPNGARLEDSVEGAAPVGLRFHPTRGAMSIGESAGGLPPDALTQDEAAILRDCERVVAALHDPADGAMVRVGVAPCSPFSVSRGLMRDAAVLARGLGVRLHTHLAENDEDVAYSRERFGMTPGEYAEDCGWTGADVWHAHCVKLTPPEIALFARTRTGVAHCPCSNCRLASGIAPVPAMLAAGVPVGLGVDGSASNDRGDLMGEARQAMLLARLGHGADAMSPRTALRMATIGGAELLGRADTGRIAAGQRADLAFWRVDGVEGAGSWDPAALALAGPGRVDRLIVEGRDVVVDGALVTVDAGAVAEGARRAAARLME